MLDKIRSNILNPDKVFNIKKLIKHDQLIQPTNFTKKLNRHKALVAMKDAVSYLFNTKSLINSFEKDLVKSKLSKFEDTDWSQKMEVSH